MYIFIEKMKGKETKEKARDREGERGKEERKAEKNVTNKCSSSFAARHLVGTPPWWTFFLGTPWYVCVHLIEQSITGHGMKRPMGAERKQERKT